MLGRQKLLETNDQNIQTHVTCTKVTVYAENDCTVPVMEILDEKIYLGRKVLIIPNFLLSLHSKSSACHRVTLEDWEFSPI